MTQLSDKDIKLLATARANEKYRRKTHILLFPSGAVILVGFLFLPSLFIIGIVLFLAALLGLNKIIGKEVRRQELILRENRE